VIETVLEVGLETLIAIFTVSLVACATMAVLTTEKVVEAALPTSTVDVAEVTATEVTALFAALAGTTLSSPSPTAAVETSAMRLIVVFVDISFLSECLVR
jgi:hypothetical protein